MLIKRRKLPQHYRVASPLEVGEVTQAMQLEIHKSKQEARIIKQEAQNILEEAQKKLQDAEAKVREIIQNAKQEAENIREKVYKETLSAANNEAEKIKSQAKTLLHEMFEVKRNALLQAHKEIINVALSLAEKIIKYQAQTNPNVLKTQVQEAIKKATTEADRVQVFVNPGDLKTLEESIPDMQKLFPTGIDIIPLENDSVDPGSCIVETKSGQLDARFSTQLMTLTNLVTNLEIKEPQINISEEVVVPDYKETEERLLKISEESFPFVQEEKSISEIVEIPQEVIQRPQMKKKLLLEDVPERTREEAEELDEDSIPPDYETEQEEQEVKELKSILKPKKSTNGISKIASELEKSPEWKDLVEEEE